MMKKLLLNISIIIFYLTTPLYSENTKVKIGVEGNFIPWNFLGDDGPNKSSKIIAIIISKSPKSIISRRMFLIFDSIRNHIINWL